MTTTDSNGIVFLEETDPVSPFHTTINALQTGTSAALSRVAKGPLYAANDTERNAYLTAYGSSATRPLWVDVAGVLQKHNGTTWVTVVGGSLPHIRLRASGTRTGLAINNWHDAPVGSTADQSGPQPWTVLANPASSTWRLRLNEAGLYLIDGSISMLGSNFATRLWVAGTPGRTIAQSFVGSVASQTSSVSTTIRLAANSEIAVQAYVVTSALDTRVDADNSPTALSVTKLSA